MPVDEVGQNCKTNVAVGLNIYARSVTGDRVKNRIASEPAPASWPHAAGNAAITVLEVVVPGVISPSICTT